MWGESGPGIAAAGKRGSCSDNEVVLRDARSPIFEPVFRVHFEKEGIAFFQRRFNVVDSDEHTPSGDQHVLGHASRIRG